MLFFQAFKYFCSIRYFRYVFFRNFRPDMVGKITPLAYLGFRGNYEADILYANNSLLTDYLDTSPNEVGQYCPLPPHPLRMIKKI